MEVFEIIEAGLILVLNEHFLFSARKSAYYRSNHYTASGFDENIDVRFSVQVGACSRPSQDLLQRKIVLL